jgi:hypothetical protein
VNAAALSRPTSGDLTATAVLTTTATGAILAAGVDAAALSRPAGRDLTATTTATGATLAAGVDAAALSRPTGRDLTATAAALLTATTTGATLAASVDAAALSRSAGRDLTATTATLLTAATGATLAAGVDAAALSRPAGRHKRCCTTREANELLICADELAGREATEAAGPDAATMSESAAGGEAGLAAGMDAGALGESAAGESEAGRSAGADATAEGMGAAAGEELTTGLDAAALGRGAAGEELSGLHNLAAAAEDRVTGQEATALGDAAGDRPSRGRPNSTATAAALDAGALGHRAHAHAAAHSTTTALRPAGLDARTDRRSAGRRHLAQMLGQRTLYVPRKAHGVDPSQVSYGFARAASHDGRQRGFSSLNCSFLQAREGAVRDEICGTALGRATVPPGAGACQHFRGCYKPGDLPSMVRLVRFRSRRAVLCESY